MLWASQTRIDRITVVAVALIALVATGTLQGDGFGALPHSLDVPFQEAEETPPVRHGLAGPDPGESLDEWTARWMDGPVGVIATDRERDLFAELETVFERLQFIRLFWQRRDPAPRDRENEVLADFARRVEWVDEHHGNGKPGWDTVFGQVVLVFGIPDRTRREISLPVGISDRPAILYSYDARFPEFPPNEAMMFVFSSGRWRLYPPSAFGATEFERQFNAAEASSSMILIPSAYRMAMSETVETTLVNTVDYETAIESVQSTVRFAEGMERSQIPFVWEAEFGTTVNGLTSVTVELTWRRSALIFHAVDDDSFETSMVVDATLMDTASGGIVTASDRFTLSVTEADLETGLEGTESATLELSAPPGTYRMQIALLDEVLGYRSATAAELVVPESS